MTLQIWFWLFYVLGLVLGFWGPYIPGQPYPLRIWGGSLLVFILIGVLGWQVFGGPVK
jgi:hypothetical protein